MYHTGKPVLPLFLRVSTILHPSKHRSAGAPQSAMTGDASYADEKGKNRPLLQCWKAPDRRATDPVPLLTVAERLHLALGGLESVLAVLTVA